MERKDQKRKGSTKGKKKDRMTTEKPVVGWDESSVKREEKKGVGDPKYVTWATLSRT